MTSPLHSIVTELAMKKPRRYAASGGRALAILVALAASFAVSAARAGTTHLGGIRDLNSACAAQHGWGYRIVLVASNPRAYGWKCRGPGGDRGIEFRDACRREYGSDAYTRCDNTGDVGCWQCYRDVPNAPPAIDYAAIARRAVEAARAAAQQVRASQPAPQSSRSTYWQPSQGEAEECNNGKRVYSAQLMGLPWFGSDWQGACLRTANTVRGQYFSAPTRCGGKLLRPGIFGFWEVPDPSCEVKLWFDPIRTKECVAGKAYRKYEGVIRGSPAFKGDWYDACRRTRASINGREYGALSCRPGWFEVVGDFEAPDASCGSRYNFDSLDDKGCFEGRTGVRKYHAVIRGQNHSGDWIPPCQRTSMRIAGQDRMPERCFWSGYTYGEFAVPDRSCATRYYFDSLDDKGCFSGRDGVRKYHAVIRGQNHSGDWIPPCQRASMKIAGQDRKPERCFWMGFTYGEFAVPDANCQKPRPVWKAPFKPLEDCTAGGARVYTAQIDAKDWDWGEACRATPATIQGKTLKAYDCKSQGLFNTGGMWGYFAVPDASCREASRFCSAGLEWVQRHVEHFRGHLDWRVDNWFQSQTKGPAGRDKELVKKLAWQLLREQITGQDGLDAHGFPAGSAAERCLQGLLWAVPSIAQKLDKHVAYWQAEYKLNLPSASATLSQPGLNCGPGQEWIEQHVEWGQRHFEWRVGKWEIQGSVGKDPSYVINIVWEFVRHDFGKEMEERKLKLGSPDERCFMAKVIAASKARIKEHVQYWTDWEKTDWFGKLLMGAGSVVTATGRMAQAALQNVGDVLGKFKDVVIDQIMKLGKPLIDNAREWVDKQVGNVIATVKSYVGIDLMELTKYYDAAAGTIDIDGVKRYLGQRLKALALEKVTDLIRWGIDAGLKQLEPLIKGAVDIAIGVVGTVPLVGGVGAAAISVLANWGIGALREFVATELAKLLTAPVGDLLDKSLDFLAEKFEVVRPVVQWAVQQANRFLELVKRSSGGAGGVFGALADVALEELLRPLEDDALKTLIRGFAMKVVERVGKKGLAGLRPEKLLGDVGQLLAEFVKTKLVEQGLPADTASGLVSGAQRLLKDPSKILARGLPRLLADLAEPFRPWLERLLSGGESVSPVARTIVGKAMEAIRRPAALGRIFSGSLPALLNLVAESAEAALRTALVDAAPAELRPVAEMAVRYFARILRDPKALLQSLRAGGLKGVAVDLVRSIGPGLGLAAAGVARAVSASGVIAQAVAQARALVEGGDLSRLLRPDGLPAILKGIGAGVLKALGNAAASAALLDNARVAGEGAR